MTINTPEALFRDVTDHLQQCRPDLFKLYPRPYLNWLIQHSIELAEDYHFGDVYSIRTFVALRWQIAPGFFKQPQIAQVLRLTSRTGQSRFEELAQEQFADAWLDAQQYDDAQEWRHVFWNSPSAY